MHRLLYAEYLPWVIKRWEHVKDPRKSGSYIWSYTGWPPNRGERRDIPSNALFHRSVIDRMDLSPDSDPKKYRTEYYMPNNSLLVQDGSAQVDERTLSELSKWSSLKDCDHESETHGLVKREKKRDINFVLANDLTNGSVAVEGQSVVVGAKDWDGIYRVVLDSPLRE